MKLQLILSIFIFFCSFKSLVAIKCMDDWHECSGSVGQSSHCSADACSVSIVPVENCGNFALRTCSVDFSCYKTLSKNRHENFNLKPLGANPLAFDYCCNGADFCNNQTDAELTAKFCVWVGKNVPQKELNNPQLRRLCGLPANSEAELIKNRKTNKERHQPKKQQGGLKCACDLNMPGGQFAHCNMPVYNSFATIRNEEDMMPSCSSRDNSCSVFLTIDVTPGQKQNATANIFRGCINRILPMSSCQNAGRNGAFVEVSTSSRPFIYEYCCNGQSFCNAVTIDGIMRKMCSWIRQQRRQLKQIRQRRPRSSALRRQLRRKYFIYRNYCK